MKWKFHFRQTNGGSGAHTHTHQKMTASAGSSAQGLRDQAGDYVDDRVIRLKSKQIKSSVIRLRRVLAGWLDGKKGERS